MDIHSRLLKIPRPLVRRTAFLAPHTLFATAPVRETAIFAPRMFPAVASVRANALIAYGRSQSDRICTCRVPYELPASSCQIRI